MHIVRDEGRSWIVGLRMGKLDDLQGMWNAGGDGMLMERQVDLWWWIERRKRKEAKGVPEEDFILKD